jgi:ribonucleoside-diphosphate reductase alpha chain
MFLTVHNMNQQKTIFDTPQQEYIAKSKYARYLDSEKRRESWDETVERYFSFAQEHITEKFPQALTKWLEVASTLETDVYTLRTMPSMRLLMTAGEAVKRNNIAAYNCHYGAIDKVRKFSDMLLILLHGTGSGFSCERQFITKLPAIPDTINKTDDVIVVKDSKEGWANAFSILLRYLYQGAAPQVDYSKVRAKGARLKTFGGRASGPEPLKRLFDFVSNLFINAAGRKLTSLEVHDICCLIADIVVVGGVRRSALISLSNLSDQRMRDAKEGQWWISHGQRGLANNSAVYTERPEIEIFMAEWLSLIKSKSGERGIFNRAAAKKQASRWNRRSADYDYGCNPCSEILLRSNQMCNLTEAVVRFNDTYETLAAKITVATIMGVYQSTLTDFKGVDPELQKNCEEERLLGVSMTGVMDHPVLNNVNDVAVEWLQKLRDLARAVATEWAGYFGINVSVAITCNKPSGTVAQLTNAGTGGLHPRFGQYYIRTYRQDNKDPLTQFLKDQGIAWEPSVMKPDTETIFSFVVKSPEGAVMRDDRTAIEQLEHWLMFQRHWCEHKPSITIYVRDHEWLEAGAWVYKHFDEISGVSFLPHDNGSYRQAPFQEITKEAYTEFLAKYPGTINWDQFIELDDQTEGSQEMACVAGLCTI